MSIINQNKVRFEMRKLDQQKATVDSNLTTPKDSALNSKQKSAMLQDASYHNPEDTSSVRSSKAKPLPEIQSEDADKLKERLLCVSCMQKPKCMLIQTCKHVPFCQDCDQEWKLKCTDQGKDTFECPICRVGYKKTIKINLI